MNETIFAQRQSYRRDLERQQMAIVRRGLSASHTYARRLIDGIPAHAFSQRVEEIVAEIEMAIANDQPLAPHLALLAADAPWVFKTNLMEPS